MQQSMKSVVNRIQKISHEVLIGRVLCENLSLRLRYMCDHFTDENYDGNFLFKDLASFNKVSEHVLTYFESLLSSEYILNNFHLHLNHQICTFHKELNLISYSVHPDFVEEAVSRQTTEAEFTELQHAVKTAFIESESANIKNLPDTISFAVNSTFAGYMVDGKREGRGVEISNCLLYVGNFNADKKTGQGIFRWPTTVPDSSEFYGYKGDLLNDHIEGTGCVVYANGTHYTGTFVNDQMDGHGTFHYHNGHTFIGNWKLHKPEGRGTFTFGPDLAADPREPFTVCGEFHWLDIFNYCDSVGGGIFEFIGTNELSECTTFVIDKCYYGFMCDDKWDGYGQFCFVPEGDMFEGYFKANVREGRGTFRYANGAIYRGNMHDDEYSGIGTFHYVTDDVYEGQFLHNMRHGKGILRYENGDHYDGSWGKDKMNGLGVHHYACGDEVLDGVWEDDVFQGENKGTEEVTTTKNKKWLKMW